MRHNFCTFQSFLLGKRITSGNSYVNTGVVHICLEIGMKGNRFAKEFKKHIYALLRQSTITNILVHLKKCNKYFCLKKEILY